MGDRVQRRQRRVPGGAQQRINVRVPDQTYAALVVRAAVAGLSLPRYLVESGLREASGGWSLRQQRWWAQRLDVVDVRLTQIGISLNQIVVGLNATSEIGADLSAAVGHLEEALARHRLVLDALDPTGLDRRPR
jgi:hypothetical protein